MSGNRRQRTRTPGPAAVRAACALALAIVPPVLTPRAALALAVGEAAP